jgi:hypothetical protein
MKSRANPGAGGVEAGAIARSRASRSLGPARARGVRPFNESKPSGAAPRGSLSLKAVTDLERMIEQSLDAKKG